MLYKCVKPAYLSCRLNRSLLSISTKLFPENNVFKCEESMIAEVLFQIFFQIIIFLMLVHFCSWSTISAGFGTIQFGAIAIKLHYP